MITRRDFVKGLVVSVATPRQALQALINKDESRLLVDSHCQNVLSEIDSYRGHNLIIESPEADEVNPRWADPWGPPYDYAVYLPGTVYWLSEDGGVTFTKRCVVE